MFYPPRIDERGRDIALGSASADVTRILTGTRADGTRDVANCADYTADSGGVAMGFAEATTGFSYHASAGCTETLRLLCFGVDRSTPVAVTPQVGRIAFLSEPWAATAGLGGADARCATDAAAAGLSGTFRALLASSTASAASRLGAAGANWVRPDGIPVAASPAALLSGHLDVPINVTAGGQYLESEVWTGASAINVVGDQTCADWTLGSDTGGEAYAAITGPGPPGFYSDSSGRPCAAALPRLFCLEQ